MIDKLPSRWQEHLAQLLSDNQRPPMKVTFPKVPLFKRTVEELIVQQYGKNTERK